MLAEAEKHNITTWVEPMVGGGNMIDKVPPSFKRVGIDLNPHVIFAMIDIRDNAENLPDSVSEQVYKSYKGLAAQPVTSWVRFVCSFGGKFENGYAREKRSNDSTFVGYGKRNALKQQQKIRNYAKESFVNAQQQQQHISGVEFIHDSFENINVFNCVIYCDPPYKGTSGYKTNSFPYEVFYEWCRKMSLQGNIVFVSEYWMPEDFYCVWQGEIKTNFASQRKEATHTAVEKLFIYDPFHGLDF